MLAIWESAAEHQHLKDAAKLKKAVRLGWPKVLENSRQVPRGQKVCGFVVAGVGRVPERTSRKFWWTVRQPRKGKQHLAGDTVRDRKHFDEVLNHNNTSSAEKAECEESGKPYPYSISGRGLRKSRSSAMARLQVWQTSDSHFQKGGPEGMLQLLVFRLLERRLWAIDEPQIQEE